MRRLAYGFIVVAASSLLVGIALYSSKPSALYPDLAGVEKPALDLGGVPRLVLTFYYAWYRPGRWGNVLDHPTLGFYNSSDREAIRRHFEFAEEAGIDGLIVSWWGDSTDEVLQVMLDVAEEVNTTVRLTVYYERVPAPESPDGAVAELEGLLNQYGGRRHFLRVQGHPVLFLYSRALGQLPYEGWDYVVRRVRHDGYDPLFMADYAGAYNRWGERAVELFDGIHIYNTAGWYRRGLNLTEQYANMRDIAARFGVLYAATVIPGYNDTHIPTRKPGNAVPRDQGETYRKAWTEARQSSPHWVLITSFNEWYERSTIEPCQEYGEHYIDLTAQYAETFKGG